ncbi:MAG TPA: patatin-like protein, partial [Pyrinomonadaceae bacterium]
MTQPPPPADGKSSPPDVNYTQEVRFAVVMYGGVSLAIYINGVAAEFFRAVRGRGVYKLIKALTDSDIIVDVISGTSAGGINGIMLAYALCNSKEFSASANLWRIDGDIRSLLRSPHRDTNATESLFNSEGYYQPRLEAAFRDMPDCIAEDSQYVSDFPELDLFVTGTDVDGNIFTQFDDAGHPIDVKDHRSVFLLKHRARRKEPFNPHFDDGTATSPDVTFQALGKLARITSCFPAAFTPVRVPDEKPGNQSADAKLQMWGKLGKDSCFLDGGVIDNKPFTYTIKEIFYRVADRHVHRKLFYVEPDPEHFAKPETATQPNFVQAVIASLIGIPGYESIADDLKLLAKHNTKIKQYQRLRTHLERKLKQSVGDRVPMPKDKAPQETPDRARREQKELYQRCSLIAISDRVIEGILKVNGREELLPQGARLAASALIDAFDSMQKKLRDDTAARDDESRHAQSRTPRILKNFDVYYRLRRLFRTAYQIEEILRHKHSDTPERRAEVEKFRNVWRMVNRQLELLDIVRVQMERLIDEAPISWESEISKALRQDEALGREDKPNVRREAETIWAIADTALQKLLGLEEEPAQLLEKALQESAARLRPMDSHTLSAFNAALKKQVGRIIEDLKSGKIREEKERETPDERRRTSDEFKGIFQRMRLFEEEFLWKALTDTDDDERSVLRAYSEFEQIDAQLYPIEWVAELHEKDIIETIRISPRDAERGFSRKGLSDKVSGDAMYHFGGFFKRSWRSNDILWGRLDSSCQLVETLLDAKRIGDVLRNPGQAAKIRARFFDNQPEDGQPPEWKHDMKPSSLFPNAGLKTHKELTEWLEELLWYGPLEIERAKPESATARTPDADDTERTPVQEREETEKQKDKLREAIERHAALLGKDKFPEKMERLIEATQLEILHEDLPNVITDALEEQAKWNQFTYPRREPSASKGKKKKGGTGRTKRSAAAQAVGGGGRAGEDDEAYPFFFKPAGGDIDPFVSVLAAASAAREEMRRFKDDSANARTPMETPLGLFFSKDYKVGSEELTRDVPLLVLMEILSVALLVLRNCMLKIFGSNAERIKAHPLYIFMIDFPLRAFNTLVLFLRRVPGAHKYFWISVAVLSAFALFVGVVWRRPIIWDRDGLHLAWLVPLIIAPSLILGTMAVYLWRGKVSDRSVWRALLYFIIATLVLTPFFVFGIAYQQVYTSATAALRAWGSSFNFFGKPYELTHTGAQLIVISAFGVTILGPWIAMSMLSLLSKKRRVRPGELRG